MMASTIWGVKDVKAMSKSTCATPYKTTLFRTSKTVEFIRAQLTAIAFLCLATTIAPAAIAQCGSNTVTLSANQWSMVGVPCVPGASNTILDVFGPSLGAANFNSTWLAYKRIYDDPVQCAVTSEPNDCYVRSTSTDTVSVGDAFWIYTLVEQPLDFSTIGASSTPGPEFVLVATSSTAFDDRYYMLANPYASTVSWSDLRITGFFLGFASVDYTIQEAVDAGVVSANVYYWNGINTYFTRSLTSLPDPATFEPKQSAWIQYTPLSVLFNDLMVHIPEPVGP